MVESPTRLVFRLFFDVQSTQEGWRTGRLWGISSALRKGNGGSRRATSNLGRAVSFGLVMRRSSLAGVRTRCVRVGGRVRSPMGDKMLPGLGWGPAALAMSVPGVALMVPSQGGPERRCEFRCRRVCLSLAHPRVRAEDGCSRR